MTIHFLESPMTEGLVSMRRKLSTASILEMPLDGLFLAVMIGVCNFHMITGRSCENLIFQFDAVASGEIYRLLTHPFVHLSWYHFLLDGGAFILLYSGLHETKRLRKLMLLGICGLSSLVTSLIFAPAIYTQGLCGLSGVGHGLMAFSALEMMRKKSDFNAGMMCLLAVVLKSLYEAAAGDVIFSFLQFGLCGTPIAVCHAGGVLGGMMAYLFYH